MISVVFSTRKDNQNHIKHVEETSGIYKDLEVIQYINDGEYSLTQLYNKALKETTNDIVVFCHDDIIFETKNWGKKIVNHFKRNPDYGIVGKAGTKYMPKSGRWWDNGMTEVIGQVYHQSEGKKWLSKYSEYFGNKIEDTIIVDGLFFVVNKNNIKQTFDEDIKGFHFYEVDFCFNNFLNGVKVGVISDISITHLSIGQTNDQWENNRVQFVDKYVINYHRLSHTPMISKKLRIKNL